MKIPKLEQKLIEFIFDRTHDFSQFPQNENIALQTNCQQF